MPITEPAPADAPLSQGDILQGIRLFATKESWSPFGGQASEKKPNLCLVLSRPCVAQHKEHITVAAIEKYWGTVPADVKTFDDVLAFLTETRDAHESPDVFYLGQIPTQSGRFCARLDSIHSVQIPRVSEQRTAFLQQRRIARLHAEFARDLHVRILRAFASLGFDDISWFSTEDLNWLVHKGRGELAAAQAELQQRQSAKAQKEFQSQTYPDQQIAEAQRTITAISEKLDPYAKELARRTQSPSSPNLT